MGTKNRRINSNDNQGAGKPNWPLHYQTRAEGAFALKDLFLFFKERRWNFLKSTKVEKF